jgi:hypothetical protein
MNAEGEDPLVAISRQASLKQMQSVMLEFASERSAASETSAARATKLLQEKIDNDRLAHLIEQEKSVKKLRSVFVEAARAEGDTVTKTLAVFDRLQDEALREFAAKKIQRVRSEKKMAQDRIERTPSGMAHASSSALMEAYKDGIKPRIIEVESVEISQVSKIDDVQQLFAAIIFVQFKFPGGKRDTDLWNTSGEDFPIGPDGKPTFKPTAKWYFEHIELCNHISGSIEKLDESIYTHKDCMRRTATSPSSSNSPPRPPTAALRWPSSPTPTASRRWTTTTSTRRPTSRWRRRRRTSRS